MTFDTPVALFFFRRPETTSQVFEQIRALKPSRLFLISDGPRPDIPDDVELVQRCRELVGEVDWPCEVTLVYAPTNMGCKARLISGLDTVFASVDSAIILEDDCLPSSSFFHFCGDLLGRYASEKRMGLVSGNKFHASQTSTESYDFSHDALIWGWATWSRVWREFRSTLPRLESGLAREELTTVRRTFSSRIKKWQFMAAVEAARTNAVDAWDIPFATFIRLRKLLVAIPEQNLVQNIGFGPESTHTKFEAFDVDISAAELNFPLRHPEKPELNPRIERREIRTKMRKWLTFPLAHPWEFTRRFATFFFPKGRKIK